jgi:DNA polymerase-3 subunit gamma/tau
MPLSRLYRPQTFADVTGQQHVTETLRREVAQGLIGHAYLFSGPRGVGKTTSARIFAKALLCERSKDGEPCNECDACREVTEHRCVDLIEMDAASHTGVDNVREAIIEHVRFVPARWKRKIYVIDEAHMLSTSAWNALLKTLEEPPEYAVFMLATTELHKVPATIMSRCQRFEFKRIAPTDMTERLSHVAKEEGLKVDAEVIAAIVRSADGYVRDAESLLDQLASLGEKKITLALAELVLPASRLPEAAKLLKTCAEHNVGRSLQVLRELLDSGSAPLLMFDDLLEVTRLLIRSEDPNEAALLKAGDEGQQAVHGLIGTYSADQLHAHALVLIERRRDAKSGVDAVFALELAIVAITIGSGAAATSVTAKGVAVPAPQPTPTVAPKPAPPVTRMEAPVTDPQPPTEALKKEEAPVPIVSTPAPMEAAEGELSLHDVLVRWREIIRVVEHDNRSLPFVLKITRPETIQGSTVVLRFQYPFHKEKIIDDLKSKRIVENALRTVLNRPDLLIDGVVGETIGESDRPTTTDIVSKVLNAFGGSVVE